MLNWEESFGSGVKVEFEQCCSNCGDTYKTTAGDKSLIALAVESTGFFKVNCLDPCRECGKKTERVIYRL